MFSVNWFSLWVGKEKKYFFIPNCYACCSFEADFLNSMPVFIGLLCSVFYWEVNWINQFSRIMLMSKFSSDLRVQLNLKEFLGWFCVVLLSSWNLGCKIMKYVWLLELYDAYTLNIHQDVYVSIHVCLFFHLFACWLVGWLASRNTQTI